MFDQMPERANYKIEHYLKLINLLIPDVISIEIEKFDISHFQTI